MRIDENLGDYDSLPIIPTPAPKEIYPSEKNETDGEIALHRAIAAGAKFIVSPGCSKKVAKVCMREGIPYLPGVVTPTEGIKALSMPRTKRACAPR